MIEDSEARRAATVDAGREASRTPAATERRLRMLLINPNTSAATTELMLRISTIYRIFPVEQALPQADLGTTNRELRICMIPI